MPAWRRRRLSRLRRKERRIPDNCIILKHSDGTIKKYILPATIQAPHGWSKPLKWNGKGKFPEGPGPFLVTISMDAIFQQCGVCGQVWQKPHQHTRAECGTNVARKVLEE